MPWDLHVVSARPVPRGHMLPMQGMVCSHFGLALHCWLAACHTFSLWTILFYHWRFLALV